MQVILVDYLTISMPLSENSPDSLIARLNAKREDFAEYSYSQLRNFNRCMQLGGFKIHWQENGAFENALIAYELSGTGCRLVESLNPGFDWIKFIVSILCNEGTHLARLDIACDEKLEGDEKPLLTIEKLHRHAKENRYSSLASRILLFDLAERGLKIGSGKSDRFLRIYDKALERNVSGHWIRVEFQLKNDCALSFFMRAMQYGDIGKAYYGMLADYIRFTREVNTGINQDRLTPCRWWKEFCNNAQRIKGFYLGGLEYNLDKLEHYIGHQTGSSLKTYIEYHGGDVGQLLDLIQDAKLNPKQEFLLKAHAMTRKMWRDYYPQDGPEPPKLTPRTEAEYFAYVARELPPIDWDSLGKAPEPDPPRPIKAFPVADWEQVRIGEKGDDVIQD